MMKLPCPVWDFKNGNDFNNYGAGVYTYENGKFTQIFDESISTTSVQIDSKGTIYISDIDGNIYRKEKNKDYQKIYADYHYRSKGIELSPNGDYLYLASFGGGLLKLENLNSLYEHECTGGKATCTKKAVCDICGEEYGELANHQYDEGKVTKKATVNEEGEKTYTCNVCKKTKIEVIPKLKEDTDKKDDDGPSKDDDTDKKDDNEPSKDDNTNKKDENSQNKTEQGTNNNTQNKVNNPNDNTVVSKKLPAT